MNEKDGREKWNKKCSVSRSEEKRQRDIQNER